jgi:ATP synthase protein I
LATTNETHSGERPASPGSPDRGQRAWATLKFSSIGIELAVAIFLGWGFGYWLDLQLETYPLLMFLFLAVGVAAGFKGVFRAAREAQEMMGDPTGFPRTRPKRAGADARWGDRPASKETDGEGPPQ